MISPLKQQSVMQHNFARIPRVDLPRSTFNRSHGYKSAFDSGYIYPFYCDEALPGDTFSVDLTAIARLATPIHPIMDNIFMDFHFFFVPNRLLWDNWQKMMGEQANPGDSIDYTVPIVTAPVGGYAEGSLFDYMGIPIDVASIEINALHSRAYNLIWREWYRDENLQNAPVVDTDDGPDTDTDYVLLPRGKRHDYFTSCLPWPQKGTAVELPLGSVAPVLGIGALNSTTTDTSVGSLVGYGPSSEVFDYAKKISDSTHGDNYKVYLEQQSSNGWLNVRADLSNATAATINDIREAFQLQRMMERDARAGTRYTEILQSHFNVVSPDQRLQRPEFLGGGTRAVNIMPIAQTESSNATSEQGNLAAIGFVQGGGIGFTKSFVEHGVILGLVSIRADLTYQQGIDRMWSRQTRYDFYWPSLAHLGEQEVLNKEIYAQGIAADENVFGYQERWAEYRYANSHVTGTMRSAAAAPLDAWHLSQEFGGLPTLNSSFILEQPPISRVVADAAAKEFIFDAYLDVKTTRCMPTYAIPGMIDHL